MEKNLLLVRRRHFRNDDYNITEAVYFDIKLGSYFTGVLLFVHLTTEMRTGVVPGIKNILVQWPMPHSIVSYWEFVVSVPVITCWEWTIRGLHWNKMSNVMLFATYSLHQSNNESSLTFHLVLHHKQQNPNLFGYLLSKASCTHTVCRKN